MSLTSNHTNTVEMESMIGLRNCVIHTGQETLQNHSVLIKNDLIDAIISLDETDPKNITNWYDLQGAHLSSGFIDLQLNGGNGVMLNGAVSTNTLDTMEQMCFKTGCTRFLPTLITTSMDEMQDAFTTIRQWKTFRNNNQFGLHLEGPFINRDYKGVHQQAFIQKPTPEMLTKLCDNSDVISMITLAPEVCPEGAIEELTDAGIHVSIGHSAATWDQVCDSFRHGAHCVTHLFNQMSPLHHREPGIVGAALDTPGIHAGFIADGYHAAWPIFRLSRRLMRERLFLVTDGMPPSGSHMDTFIIQGQEVKVEAGRCINAEGRLCGSALTMIQAIKNCIEKGGVALDEALRMATLYPATALGVNNQHGAIKMGMKADFTAFDDKFDILLTIQNGHIVQNNL